MTKSKIQVVFDAGPLITACKFETGGKLVVDHLLSGCYILINLGFEHRLQQLYKEFEAGGISLGHFATELGLGIRDLYAALEQRNLPTSNIGAKPVWQSTWDTDYTDARG